MTDPTPFRIVAGRTPVGVVRAIDSEEALRVFTDGRGLPPECELRAYSVRAYTTRRPRAAKGWRP